MFYVFCFAICTPQTKYINNKRVNDALIKADFYGTNIPEDVLQGIVKPVRFYRNKAKWLLEAKHNYRKVIEIVAKDIPITKKREELINNFNGVGMKVASEFLKDIGYKDLAVIDVHIAKYLNMPLPRNNKEYIWMEELFTKQAKQKNITPSELDTVVWREYSGN
jgi:thermostable 8-oxoguanine DNA glycosylase